MQMWLIKPAKEVVAGAALLVLTYLAGALRPKLLYAANGIGNIDDTTRPMFLDYRLFILSLIVSAELVSNESLTGLLLENNPEFPSLPLLGTRGLVMLMIFLAIALGALQVWISARCSKTPLSMSQSMKVSGYGLGVAFITPFILLPLAVTSVMLFFEYFPSIPAIIQLVSIALLLVPFCILLVHLQFIGPVSAYYPSASNGRLFLGWFMGLLLLPLGLALGLGVVIALVFLLVRGVGFISSLG